MTYPLVGGYTALGAPTTLCKGLVLSNTLVLYIIHLQQGRKRCRSVLRDRLLRNSSNSRPPRVGRAGDAGTHSSLILLISHLILPSRSTTGKSSLPILTNTTKSDVSCTPQLTRAVQSQSTATRRSARHRKRKKQMPDIPARWSSSRSPFRKDSRAATVARVNIPQSSIYGPDCAQCETVRHRIYYVWSCKLAVHGLQSDRQRPTSE